MDAGGQVAQVVDRRLRVLERVVDEAARALGVLLPALLGELEVDHDVDELLLGAVVEVAAEPAALLVAGLQDARARRGELLARVGVGERVGDQLGEAGDPLLRVVGQAVRAPGGGDHGAPQAARDDDRRADRRADADRAQAHRELVLELVVAVHAHGAAAAQHPRRDRLAVHREVRGDREGGRAARGPRRRGPCRGRTPRSARGSSSSRRARARPPRRRWRRCAGLRVARHERGDAAQRRLLAHERLEPGGGRGGVRHRDRR